MNHYETIFIVAPDTPETDQDSIFEKVKSLISQDGKLIMFDDWGSRKFAYEIKKKRQGRYVRLDYCGNGIMVDEIERIFRLDYRILKFMTVLLAQDVDPETMIPVENETEAEAEAGKSADTAAAENISDTAAEAEAPETESKTESETEE